MAEFQASEEEQFVPREIVRAFSMRIREEYEGDVDETELGRALVEKAKEDESQQKKRIKQINEYLNSTRPQELAKLKQLRRSLELSMHDFCIRVQKSQPQDALPNKINSWEDVALIVEGVMGRLQQKKETDKFRRATKHFRTFCNTIKSHSTALKMLPTNNDYVKVFYGALATVIQASENYTKVMEALPRALVEINDAVAAIEKRSWLFENDTMKSYMWRVYSQIFAFLGEVISWYTKRSAQRLLNSFNEHLPEFFDDQVEEIKKLSKLVLDEADFRAQADAQINRLYLEEMDGKVDTFMKELRERDAAQRDVSARRYERFHEALEKRRRDELWDEEILRSVLMDTLNKMKRHDTGFAMAQILEADAQRQIAWPDNSEHVQKTHNDELLVPSQGIERRAIMQGGISDTPASGISRDALLLSSSDLEGCFDRSKLEIPGALETNAMLADPNVADRIRSWVVATDSQILYTCGADPFEGSSQGYGTAGQYTEVIRQARLPVCSYSCSLTTEAPPKGRTRETMELVSLVYSLIRQSIELLPPVVETDNAIFQNFQWSRLDGTLRTFPLALEILEAVLRATGQSIIFIIIDAVDLLEDPSHKSTDRWLSGVLQLFTNLVTSVQSTTFKIWFNSGGRSSILLEGLKPHQIAFSSSSGRRSGGRVLGSEFIVL